MKHDYARYVDIWRTCFYLWTVHKNGIVVTWNHSAQAFTFNEFSNERFDNRLSWPHQNITFEFDGRSIQTAETYYAAKRNTYKIFENILSDQNRWWLNGHVLCNTADTWTSRNEELRKILEKVCRELCKSEVFFFNRRDFPQILKNSRNSGHSSFRAPEIPMFYAQEKYSVISYYGSDNHNDKLWPPPEHWRLYTQELFTPMHTKLKKAVFRGTFTGPFDNNLRLQLCTQKNIDIFDVGLTKWTQRCRITNGLVHFKGRPDNVPLVDALTPIEQSKYAIIIYVPGHVASMRLGWQLLTGSVTLIVKDPNCVAPDQWINRISTSSGPLTEDEHYVTCSMANVEDRVYGLLNNPNLMKKISENSFKWATECFREETMIEYCKSLII